MSNKDYVEAFPIIRRLEFLSLIAAIASIPFIVFQASEDEQLRQIGEIGSLTIWFYFAVEITVLLRIWEDNFEFLRSHVLEVAVVIACSPLFVLAYQAESLFGVAPLLRVVRFLKFSKIFKLVKSGKIAQKSKVPELVLWLVWTSVIMISIGLLGMILDHHAHSILDGFRFWEHSVRHGFHLQLWTVIPCMSALLIGGFLVHRAHSQRSF